jgi:inositol hexakisphosphate/diphosphoinositol-pentakisphosphate kinase
VGELIAQLDEMLDDMGSGDEKRNEDGEGLRGDSNVYFALSGAKLNKGETLLELTERWRFIYDRLYDPETDSFDLSRIPDVHDNVRFDGKCKFIFPNGTTDTVRRSYLSFWCMHSPP